MSTIQKLEKLEIPIGGPLTPKLARKALGLERKTPPPAAATSSVSLSKPSIERIPWRTVALIAAWDGDVTAVGEMRAKGEPPLSLLDLGEPVVPMSKAVLVKINLLTRLAAIEAGTQTFGAAVHSDILLYSAFIAKGLDYGTRSAQSIADVIRTRVQFKFPTEAEAREIVEQMSFESFGIAGFPVQVDLGEGRDADQFYYMDAASKEIRSVRDPLTVSQIGVILI